MATEAEVRGHVGIEDGEAWPLCAWPGGYVIGYLADDGELICGECMNSQAEHIHFGGSADGWRIEGAQTIEESESGEWCAHCNRLMFAADEGQS